MQRLCQLIMMYLQITMFIVHRNTLSKLVEQKCSAERSLKNFILINWFFLLTQSSSVIVGANKIFSQVSGCKGLYHYKDHANQTKKELH